ncbi:carbohydrate ABC transporter permease [Pseudodesulfovibrio thermohalotolerans]|uniref:carbohydrate ABC transporter permease n=1 Tax=Pseudodesulfovibrio thermohalotolerans TaxID=2880651 RepID=UPI0024434DFE|nr:carbohydrate ABC transporter permease [Pseudodesulfovibrio thermohalotolerans]WFS60904.1 carbohydrate ABC transporter permease [Pseudodesulfovibrio thermohalotolerans]
MKTKHFRWQPFLRHAILLSGACIMLVPFVWMFLASLRPPEEIFNSGFQLLPERWYVIENYSKAFTAQPLLTFMINGAIVTSAIFVLQACIATPCAYALAKLDFKGKKLLFTLILVGLLIPAQAISIPVYLLLWKLGALDSYSALIIPWTISVLGIFLMRQFFLTVSDEILDAARLDGMSEFSIIWRLMVPMAVPALTAFGIISVVAHWNDYFWPLIVLSSKHTYTPPLGVSFFANDEAGNDYGALMAAATVIIAPLVVGFLAAQEKFIKGIAMQAGLKG